MCADGKGAHHSQRESNDPFHFGYNLQSGRMTNSDYFDLT